MGFRSTPTKKARRSARRLSKRADKRRKDALKDAAAMAAATQERAAEWAERAGAVSHEFADDMAERIRHSDAIAKAQATGMGLASKAKDAWHDHELDERVSEFAQRVRSSEAARLASGRTKAVTEASLATLGDWLTTSKSGKEVGRRLGVQPRRRWPVVLATLGGMAGGFVIARLVGAGSDQPIGDVLADGVEQFGPPPGPARTVLADSIRAALASDPRTVRVSEVDINVAEGTVFVRGSIPSEVNQEAVREVIAAVPGVADVDLQLIAVGSD